MIKLIAYSETYISIHAARVGCDFAGVPITGENTIFQSTQPEWAATLLNVNTFLLYNISIHAARVGCDGSLGDYTVKGFPISIHAARVGCDFTPAISRNSTRISIHAARVGCDGKHKTGSNKVFYFNPRSPSGLRRRTITLFL